MIQSCADNVQQEAKQGVIELKEDDPDAMEEVLRHHYGCKFPVAATKPWRLWFDLVTTADKYLEPELSNKAESQLRKVAGSCEDTDTVLDIFQSIKSDMTHRESLSKFADALRKKNMSKLQKNPRYRDLLFDNRELFESHFNAFDEIKLSQDMVLKSICMCSWHREVGLRDPNDTSRSCFACTKQVTDGTIKWQKIYLTKP